jgi:hypothetical protein
MESALVVWTPEKQNRLEALGFAYDGNKWVKEEADHNEFVRATAEFLYWFDMENRGGDIISTSKFPIMDFDALIIFLKALNKKTTNNIYQNT